MGFFKRLLGLEQKEVIVEKTKEADNSNERTNILQSCQICQQEIGQAKWKRIGKLFFHKSCFKQKQRGILNGEQR